MNILRWDERDFGKGDAGLRDAQFRPEREGGLGGDPAGVPQGGVRV